MKGMTGIMDTKALNESVFDIVVSAETRLWILTGAFEINELLFDALKEKSDAGVPVRIAFANPPRDWRGLLSLPNVELRFNSQLHAKLYLNESAALDCSMNLVRFGEHARLESGTVIRKDAQPELHREKELLAEQYFALSSFFAPGTPNRWNSPVAAHRSCDAFCIRCGKRIVFNKDRPFCQECYNAWRAYRNRLYSERRCHRCGRQARGLSINYPLCGACETMSAS
jgi:hypothetical protein